MKWRSAGSIVCVAFFSLSVSSACFCAEDLPRAWTKTFPEGNVYVISTDVAKEVGISEKNGGDSTLLSRAVYRIDPPFGILAVLTGKLGGLQSLYAIDGDTGATLWTKNGFQLTPARSLGTYGERRYYGTTGIAHVLGGLVLLSVTDSSVLGLPQCAGQPSLVGLNLRNGRPIWCNGQVIHGEPTLVPIPEKRMAVLWDTISDSDVTIDGIDLMTGRSKWSTQLGVSSGKDWGSGAGLF
jgi:hypothetical protein